MTSGSVPTSPSIVTELEVDPERSSLAGVVVAAGGEAEADEQQREDEREDATGTSGHGDTFGERGHSDSAVTL